MTERLPLLFFFNIYLSICFWLHWAFIAAHGLSRVAMTGGYSLVLAPGLLTAVTSLVLEHSL